MGKQIKKIRTPVIWLGPNTQALFKILEELGSWIKKSAVLKLIINSAITLQNDWFLTYKWYPTIGLAFDHFQHSSEEIYEHQAIWFLTATWYWKKRDHYGLQCDRKTCQDLEVSTILLSLSLFQKFWPLFQKKKKRGKKEKKKKKKTSVGFLNGSVNVKHLFIYTHLNSLGGLKVETGSVQPRRMEIRNKTMGFNLTPSSVVPTPCCPNRSIIFLFLLDLWIHSLALGLWFPWIIMPL